MSGVSWAHDLLDFLDERVEITTRYDTSIKHLSFIYLNLRALSIAVRVSITCCRPVKVRQSIDSLTCVEAIERSQDARSLRRTIRLRLVVDRTRVSDL